MLLVDMLCLTHKISDKLRTIYTVPMWDGGELIAYAPEASATVYAGLRMQSPDTEGGNP